MDRLATKYCMGAGVGFSEHRLVSFDKALLDAGIGNYNLVRLSSILPAHCEKFTAYEMREQIKEGSLLPTAYSTISSDNVNERIVSTIGIGFPKDKDKVGVIMEFSAVGMQESAALDILRRMIEDAFDARNWELDHIETASDYAVVSKPGTYTTFAFVSEW